MDTNYTPGPNEQSSLGSSWKVLVVLGYIFSLVGFIFFFVEKKSAFVKFHCAQAAVIFAADVVFGVLNAVGSFVPFLSFVVGLCTFSLFVFSIFGAVKASNGVWYRIPLVADLADALRKNVK